MQPSRSTTTSQLLRALAGCAALAAAFGAACYGTPPTSEVAQALIECNSTTIDQPCDTDDTVCTPEMCRQIGLGVECVPEALAADGTACESDGMPCTGDSCDGGACVHVALAVGASCIDGLFCSSGETCDAAGVCGGGAATCDDDSACTIDACDEADNACSHAAVVCVPDANACTGDSCDPVAGCVHPALGPETSCDDGRFCSVEDRCDGDGGCAGTLGCIDGNPCTLDACDEDADLCSNVVDEGASCNDDNGCTDGDVCDPQGACGGADVVDGTICTDGGGCLAGGVCTGGSCGAASAVPDGTPCGDADGCTSGEVCNTGVCEPGGALVCDDGSECTIDGCDPAEGCVTQAIDACDTDAGVPDAGASGDDAGGDDAGGDDAGGDDAGGLDAGVESDAQGGGDGGALAFTGELGGGGCAVGAVGGGGGGGGGWLVLCAAAMVLGLGARRRRAAMVLERGARRGRAAMVLGLGARRRRAAVVLASVAAAVVVAPAAARADGFDAVTYRPSPSASAYFSQDGPGVLRRGGWRIGLGFDLARDLLVVRDPDSGAVLTDGEVVSERSVLHLGAAVGFPGGFELAADLPLALAQSGDLALVRPGDELGGTRLGDLRVHGKVRLGRHLALATTIGLPTGSAEDFTGDGALSVTPRLVLGLERGRFALSGSVGYRVRSATSMTNLAIDDELVAGLAGSVQITGRVWLLGEAYLAAGLDGESGERAIPAEGIAGIRWAVAGPWMVQVGAGAGLSQGYGTPSGRGVLTVAYAPVAAPPRRPHIEIARVEPPAEPEPAPVAPAPPPEPEPVALAPADADGDGFVDGDDGCPDQPEVVNGVDDTDGCPDEGLIELVDDRIILEERVLFDTDRARVRHRGKRILAAVITLWGQHPEWEHVIIEGHTDDRGDADYNVVLGEQRAARVRAALVEQGVPTEKIEVQSFGESHPRVPGHSADDLAKNRRVEFVIIKKVPAPIAAAQ